jgi:hypothetical protein
MMAEATTKGSEKLVNALTDINKKNKEKGSRKIDFQKEIHAAILEYKKKREGQLQKTQGYLYCTIVMAISNLVEALGRMN